MMNDLKKTGMRCEYKGIRQMAAPNTHNVAFELLDKPFNARICDMPCGAGALTQRLVDEGFVNVVYADINQAEARRVPNATFVPVDLSGRTPFADEEFDAVFCVECIEHLENPFHLMRELTRIVRVGGGEIIISTPNVMTTAARSKFFSGGYFPHFDDLACRWDRQKTLGYQAHITPIPLHWLLYMAHLNGLKLIEVRANEYSRRPRLKDRIIAKIVKVVSRRFYEPRLYDLLVSDVALFGDILVAKFVRP